MQTFRKLEKTKNSTQQSFYDNDSVRLGQPDAYASGSVIRDDGASGSEHGRLGGARFDKQHATGRFTSSSSHHPP